MIKQKRKQQYSKIYEFAISMILHWYQNSIIYSIVVLVESLQLYSYIYNILHLDDTSSSYLIELYSKISTYTRVLSLSP